VTSPPHLNILPMAKRTWWDTWFWVLEALCIITVLPNDDNTIPNKANATTESERQGSPATTTTTPTSGISSYTSAYTTGMLQSITNGYHSARKLLLGDSNPREIHTLAGPGLMTLFDVALYRANEGSLVATICTANGVLRAFLALKYHARCLLHLLDERSDDYLGSVGTNGGLERFVVLCVECANGAIAALTTEPLSTAANIPRKEHVSNSIESLFNTKSAERAGSERSLATNSGTSESDQEAFGTRTYRRKDCWETPRLLCPDHVWSQDAIFLCAQLLAKLSNHPFMSGAPQRAHPPTPSPVNGAEVTDADDATPNESLLQESDQIKDLIRTDIPHKLNQFKIAAESDSVASKRLFLVKCEYRGPFRSYLEACATLRRAPRIEMVDQYLAIHQKGVSTASAGASASDGLNAAAAQKSELDAKKLAAERKIQNALANPLLLEALRMEQRCEVMEYAMAQMVGPFCDLARQIDSKRASGTQGRLKEIPGVLTADGAPRVDAVLEQLKTLLVCHPNDTITGIRPLLLTLQEPLEFYLTNGTVEDSEYQRARSLEDFILQLTTLTKLCRMLRGGSTSTHTHTNPFQLDTKQKSAEIPNSVLKGVETFDPEMFGALFEDWYTLVKRQHQLTQPLEQGENHQTSTSFAELSETIRQGEVELGIAVAPQSSLKKWRERLEHLDDERVKRFEVLQECGRNICLREMNLVMNMFSPSKSLVLDFPEMSALGVFGNTLLGCGETLPIG